MLACEKERPCGNVVPRFTEFFADKALNLRVSIPSHGTTWSVVLGPLPQLPILHESRTETQESILVV
jgi:hypothetical protein